MAKNKILGWMGALQGIKDVATVAQLSFRKTTLDALKAMAAMKSIIVKTVPEKPKDIHSYAKDMGIEAIRNLKLPEPVSPKMTEGQLKSERTDGGIIFKDLVRKPGSQK